MFFNILVLDNVLPPIKGLNIVLKEYIKDSNEPCFTKALHLIAETLYETLKARGTRDIFLQILGGDVDRQSCLKENDVKRIFQKVKGIFFGGDTAKKKMICPLVTSFVARIGVVVTASIVFYGFTDWIYF